MGGLKPPQPHPLRGAWQDGPVTQRTESPTVVVSERQKGSAQGRILGGPRGPWPTLFLRKFENYIYRILASFPATGVLNFFYPSPASADRLEQNLGDDP